MEEGEELTRIGHGDFVDFIGIQPNFSSPALEHAGCKTLLEFERHHRSPASCSLSALPLRRDWGYSAMVRRFIRGDSALGFETIALGYLGPKFDGPSNPLNK